MYLSLNELIPGKWYTNKKWTDSTFAKFHFIRSSKFCFSESFYSTYQKPDTPQYWSNYDGEYKEVPLETLIKYLPEDHPDLVIKPLEKEDLTYLTILLEKLNIK